MAKFLNTQQISSEINSLIKEAEQELTLVSYSLKVHPKLLERIQNQIEENDLKEICIIYGSSAKKDQEFNKLKQLSRVRLLERDDLHAKCYLNEKTAIICSMNLYDYSQQNNIEYGILITKRGDREAYQELYSEVQYLKKAKYTKIGYVNEDASGYGKEGELNLHQKLQLSLLKEWRDDLLKPYRIGITDVLLEEIISLDRVDREFLRGILRFSDNELLDEVISLLNRSHYYTKGEVLAVNQPSTGYAQVKFKNMETGKIDWYDTTQQLPKVKSIVGVKLNGSWFNRYVTFNQ